MARPRNRRRVNKKKEKEKKEAEILAALSRLTDQSYELDQLLREYFGKLPHTAIFNGDA